MSLLESRNGFTRAYSEHYPLAFSAAYRVLGDAAAAEDVVQDVFTVLWRDPSKFDPARGGLPGYVAMMARSRAVDRARSRTAGAAAVERLGVRDAGREAEVESPAQSVVRRDEAGRVLAALAGLPGGAARRRAPGLRPRSLDSRDRDGGRRAARHGEEPPATRPPAHPRGARALRARRRGGGLTGGESFAQGTRDGVDALR